MKGWKFELPKIPEIDDLPKDISSGNCFRAMSDRELLRKIAYFPDAIETCAWIGSLTALLAGFYIDPEEWTAWTPLGFVCLPLALAGTQYLDITGRYRRKALQYRDEYLAGKFDAARYFQHRMTSKNPDPRLPARPLRFFYDPMQVHLVHLLC